MLQLSVKTIFYRFYNQGAGKLLDFYDKIADLDALETTLLELCYKGSGVTDKEFENINLEQVQTQLKTGTFNFSTPKYLTVGGSEKRKYASFGLAERIITCMLYKLLSQVLDPLFIDNLFSHRKNKSYKHAITNLQESMRKNLDGYILRLDVERYYDSIDHEILLSFIPKHVDAKTKQLKYLSRLKIMLLIDFPVIVDFAPLRQFERMYSVFKKVVIGGFVLSCLGGCGFAMKHAVQQPNYDSPLNFSVYFTSSDELKGRDALGYSIVNMVDKSAIASYFNTRENRKIIHWAATHDLNAGDSVCNLNALAHIDFSDINDVIRCHSNLTEAKNTIRWIQIYREYLDIRPLPMPPGWVEDEK
jgi:hypothetical protein